MRPHPFMRLARLSGLTAGLLLVVMAAASAQALTESFGGLSESSKDPIDIESDVLVVHDAKKYATFKGNVKAVQGTTTLRASQLDVHYVGGAEDLAGGAKKAGSDAKAEPANDPAAQPQSSAAVKSVEGKTPATKTADAKSDNPGSKITKIEARGEVIITSKDDQTTTSDWALYDVPARMVTVGGNVVLTQGQNVLKGDRLVINLQTGESRFENTGEVTPGKRIRALFMPKEDGGSGAKSDTKPGSTAKPGERGAEKSAEPATGAQQPAARTEDPKTEDPWNLLPNNHE